MENKNKTNGPSKKFSVREFIKNPLNVVGVVLCIILIPILVTNCVLIVKGMLNEKEAPSLGKNVPLIVITESMEPEINAGDLIVVRKVDAQTLKEGDVIAFFDPAGNGTSIVTHKIKTVYYNEDGTIKEFETYGINNFNADGTQAIDRVHVPVSSIVGIYNGFSIPVIGHVAMFMQSTWGLVVCIGIPLTAFIVYEVLRRRKADMANKNDMDALMAELEALKKAQAESAQSTEAQSSEQPTGEDN